MARLDVYQKGSPRFEVGLPATGGFLIGRGPGCDLVLPDPLISREHARIEPAEGGGYLALDLSANGTLVNGEPVGPGRPLGDEDVIEIASYRLFYRVRSARAGVHPTIRRAAHPTRILSLEGTALTSERAWLEGEGLRVELSGKRQILGSDGMAAIRLGDAYVSRLHAAISPVGAAWQIEDLGSTNGTFVGGRRIEKAEIKDGDRIALGQLEILFRAKQESEILAPSAEPACGAFIGEGEPMRRLFSLVSRVAPTDAPVLILGESGTGKELLAAAIHDGSQRAGRAFVPVHCGAIPESLAESELFGHEKGAFTGATQRREGLFAQAHGGTLFLDEIGEMPPPLQVKLLRALESGEIRPVGGTASRMVDVRVVAATHKDLAALVREGSFREDLYFRLAVVSLPIPALREREGDLPALAASFLPPGRRLNSEAQRKLQGRPWPGNVRELKNVIERAAIFSEPGEIGADAIVFDELGAAPDGGFFARYPELAGKSLEEIERLLITEALRTSGGVQAEAAKALGIAKSTLYGKIERYGLREKVRGG